MLKRLLTLLACLSLATLLGGWQFTIPYSTGANAHSGGGGGIVEVQGPTYTNDYSGTSLAFASNVTSGNTLFVAVNVNGGTLVVAGTGTGCALTTWTAGPSEFYASVVGVYTWTGTASGSGPCTVAITGGSSAEALFLGEYSGVAGIDATGSNGAVSGTALTVTSSPATTVSGDFAITIWADNGASTTTASGWTDRIGSAASGYSGIFTQSSIASGTTVTWPGVFTGGAYLAGATVVFKP